MLIIKLSWGYKMMVNVKLEIKLDVVPRNNVVDELMGLKLG